jgi:hypothetical protein
MREVWKNPDYVKIQKTCQLGDLNHNYKGKVELICPICNNTFSDTPVHAKDRICCSNDCQLVYRSRKYSGEGNPFFGKSHTPEAIEIFRNTHTRLEQSLATRKKRSESNKKVVHTQEWRDRQSASLKNREITWADKISASHQGLTLDKWEGFITPLYLKIRASQQYDTWRRAVFERDDFRDWFSGIKGNGNLNAHHVVPFAEILKQYNIQTFEEALKCEALWNISNGVTMIDTNHASYHAVWG